MVYNIVYKKSVQRDLKKLPKEETGRILHDIEHELARNADTYPALKGQFAGLRKYRIGNYRIIYAIVGDDVLVLRVAHRKEVYKRAP